MDPTSYTNSKRPPKLRAACNECHAAKVRCSGEKTGCQRCSNLHLKCAFSISRIGKVPGKRSKANRVAAATVSTSSSAPISTSSSSISTPILSPPLLTAARPFEDHGPYDAHNGIPVSTTSYPLSQSYPTGSCLRSDAAFPQSPGYHAESVPEDLPSLNNICWTTELDQLGGPGLLSPDWELDADDTIAPLASASNSTYPNVLSEAKDPSRQDPSPVDSLPSAHYTLYLHLLHCIDQTIQFSHQVKSPGHEITPMSTLDSVLLASQRYTATLLQLTSGPTFTQTYNEDHLLFSVALEKLIYLFSFAYADFKRSIEVYEGMGIVIPRNGTGTMERFTRYGAFELDVAEQMGLCSRVFMEEIKRATVCLSRLMDAMGLGMGAPLATSTGRHEMFCEDMRRRLDALMDGFEWSHGSNGVHLVC
ncbi:Zn(II)2Cys6 transcription factor domain-containing protein [Aspergillus stella-maris]|uniref:Zn(II)2Cys6 transcription factor domain-containing protein n=1 Tax=Aspergillus stella-maris TaxID=1810926 RepID=UPI003CCC9336